MGGLLGIMCSGVGSVPQHCQKTKGWRALWWIGWIGDWYVAERRGPQGEDIDHAQSGDLGLPEEVSVVWGPKGRSEPSVEEYLVTDHEWDNRTRLRREDTISHVSQGACSK